MIFSFDTLKQKLEYEIMHSTWISILPQRAFQVTQLIPFPDIFLAFPYTVAICGFFTEYCIVYQTYDNILFHGKEREFRKQNKPRQDGTVFLSV